MSIQLNHPWALSVTGYDDLFKDCHKLSTFMTRVQKKALKEFTRQEDQWKFYGDAFEAFTEALFKMMGSHPELQIADYQTVDLGDDYGVDGIGRGWDGTVHTVQCKARSNSEKLLTPNSDKLANFVAHSDSRYGLAGQKVKHLTLVTNAKGMHYVGDLMFQDRVHVISNEVLRDLVDNNFLFWEQFHSAIAAWD